MLDHRLQIGIQRDVYINNDQIQSNGTIDGRPNRTDKGKKSINKETKVNLICSIQYNIILEVHNQNIKYKQAREERLTSKYKQSRIQHKEQLKEKSAQLAASFVEFQKRAAKMSPKDMDSDSEMAVLR